MPSERVRVPAILMIVVSALNILFTLAGIAYYTFVLGLGLAISLDSQGANAGQEDRLVFVVLMTLVVGISAAVVALHGFVVWAGFKMHAMERHGVAVAGAVILLLSVVTGGCCVISVPVGAYALYVLNDRAVKDAFRA